MKATTKIQFFSKLFLLSVLLVGYGKLSAQTTWDYPVKPGTPQWEAFMTHDEMLKAIQIPDDVLRALTTKELVEICLNYPLSVDFYAYNSLQEGLKRNVAVNFNGIQELFRRQDNAQCLLAVLEGEDLVEVQSLKNISTVQTGKSIVKHALTEVLLSHESVIVNADTKQQKEIAMIAVKNLLLKKQQPHLYSQYSLETSAYLLGTVLKKGKEGVALSPGLEMFLQAGTSQDVTLLTEELVNHYVKF